jgi:hypothetical protein
VQPCVTISDVRIKGTLGQTMLFGGAVVSVRLGCRAGVLASGCGCTWPVAPGSSCVRWRVSR